MIKAKGAALAIMAAAMLLPTAALAQPGHVEQRASYPPEYYQFGYEAALIARWEHGGAGWSAYAQSGNMIRKKFGTWNNNYYLLDANGVMVTGWYGIWQLDDEQYGPPAGGVPYYFDASGKMAMGWEQIGGYWYYFLPNGLQQTYGTVAYKNRVYMLDNTHMPPYRGRMVTGWYMVDGAYRYYRQPAGDMVTGWLRHRDSWYYLDPKKGGDMLSNEWVHYGGQWYYLGSTGAMASASWVKAENGNWYYLKQDGAMMHSGSMVIGGKTYRFGPSGIWLG